MHDLEAMLGTMKLQQAAIEARVNTMQSAVLQLVPDSVSSGILGYDLLVMMRQPLLRQQYEHQACLVQQRNPASKCLGNWL